MKGRLRQLVAVSKSLKSVHPKLEKLNFASVFSGMKVAVSINKNLFIPEADYTGSIYRGVVKQVLPSIKVIRVILVDFGLEQPVQINQINELPDIFQQIPAFGFRCHLDKPGILPPGGWNDMASNNFRKYVMSWNEEIPFYYGYVHYRSNIIGLEEFSQKVVYHEKDKKWIAGPQLGLESEKVINRMKKDPLLHNYFLSCGLAIDYEKTTDRDEFYHCVGVEDILQSESGEPSTSA